MNPRAGRPRIDLERLRLAFEEARSRLLRYINRHHCANPATPRP